MSELLFFYAPWFFYLLTVTTLQDWLATLLHVVHHFIDNLHSLVAYSRVALFEIPKTEVL